LTPEFPELSSVASPIVEGGKVIIQSLTISPVKGPAGTTFTTTFKFTVVNATGTGEIYFEVDPPAGLPLVGGEVNAGLAPNDYTIQFTMDSTPNESEPFLPGLYNVTAAVCNGECGSSHPYSAVLGVATGNLTISG